MAKHYPVEKYSYCRDTTRTAGLSLAPSRSRDWTHFQHRSGLDLSIDSRGSDNGIPDLFLRVTWGSTVLESLDIKEICTKAEFLIGGQQPPYLVIAKSPMIGIKYLEFANSTTMTFRFQLRLNLTQFTAVVSCLAASGCNLQMFHGVPTAPKLSTPQHNLTRQRSIDQTSQESIVYENLSQVADARSVDEMEDMSGNMSDSQPQTYISPGNRGTSAVSPLEGIPLSSPLSRRLGMTHDWPTPSSNLRQVSQGSSLQDTSEGSTTWTTPTSSQVTNPVIDREELLDKLKKLCEDPNFLLMVQEVEKSWSYLAEGV